MDKNTIQGEALYRALHRLQYGRTRWDWVDMCAIASTILIVVTWTVIGLRSCESPSSDPCPALEPDYLWEIMP